MCVMLKGCRLKATQQNTHVADMPINSNADTSDDNRVEPDRGSPPSMPRWVKVFGIVVIVLVLLFVVLHLAGGGFRGH